MRGTNQGPMPKSFNRTFMELKLGISGAPTASFACFNRTFMELKSYYCKLV